MAQQNQRWSNPGPAVLFAVAVLVACLGGIRIGAVPSSGVPLMMGVLWACFLPQLIGGVIALRNGEVVLGSISIVFGTVITLGASFALWFQIFGGPKPGTFTPEIMSFFWFTLTIVTGALALGFGRMSWFVMAGVFDITVAFLLEGLNIFNLAGVGFAAGILELIFCAWCLYTAATIMYAEYFGRPVLPIGKPVFK